jgi:hypothetical protein
MKKMMIIPTKRKAKAKHWPRLLRRQRSLQARKKGRRNQSLKTKKKKRKMMEMKMIRKTVLAKRNLQRRVRARRTLSK